jgi:hypothetical protein
MFVQKAVDAKTVNPLFKAKSSSALNISYIRRI